MDGKTEVEQWVSGWLAENTDAGADVAGARADADLFADGVLDSMKFIFFVSAAEAHFGIRFTQSDFDFSSRRFTSFSGLCSLIGGHLG